MLAMSMSELSPATTRRRAQQRFEQQLSGQHYTTADQTSSLAELPTHTPTRRQLAQQRFMVRHQTAPSSTNEHGRQQAARVAALWDVFRAFDLDGSGGIERGELMQLGQARRMLGQKEGNWSLSQNERLVASLGGAQDGKVGGASFVAYFERALAGLSAAEFDSTIEQFTEVAVSCHQTSQSPNAAYSNSNNAAWPHNRTSQMAEGQSNRSTYTSSYPSDPSADSRLAKSIVSPVVAANTPDHRWECAACQFLNQRAESRCGNCADVWQRASLQSASLESASWERASWECLSCQFLNQQSELQCGNCAGARTGSLAGAQATVHVLC